LLACTSSQADGWTRLAWSMTIVGLAKRSI
jgi:hypothetical protein